MLAQRSLSCRLFPMASTPARWAQGATIDEVMANIREAIELHLADEDPVALGISTTAPMLTMMQLEPLRA